MAGNDCGRHLLYQTRKQAASVSVQRGMALIVLLFLIGLAGTTYIVKNFDATAARIKRDQRTTEALEEAKAAIVAWSLMQTVPGRLPCPEDTAAIGTANEGQEASGSCSNSQPSVGRLAWRTLGLGDLRDGNGDRLWYVISPGFRNSPINSDTTPQITADGAQAAAIVFSAGPALGTQSRPVPSAGSPPIASDYLDTPNSTANQTAFVSTPQSDTFNDRMLMIKIDDFIPAVEKLALAEVKTSLNNYFTTYGYYPFAATLGATSSANQCVQNNLQGLLPTKDPGVACECTYGSSKVCSCNWASAGLTVASYNRTTSTPGYFNNPTGLCSVTTTSVSGDTCRCTGAGNCKRSTTATVRFSCDANGCQFLNTSAGNFKFYSSQPLSIPADSQCTESGGVVTCNVASSSGTYTFTAGNCTDPAIGSLPSWITTNNWQDEIVYALSSACTSANHASCTGTGIAGHLTVGISEARALLLAPGKRFTASPYAVSKAAAQSTRPSTNISDYLDSVENTDSDTSFDAVNTHRTSNYNDQISIIAP